MRNEIEEVLREHGVDYQPEELYVHIPSSGKTAGPHIELEDDYSMNQISQELNNALMDLVDVSEKQPATKHQLLDVLVGEAE